MFQKRMQKNRTIRSFIFFGESVINEKINASAESVLLKEGDFLPPHVARLENNELRPKLGLLFYSMLICPNTLRSSSLL